ncbi:MAG: hypothetical protein JXR77_09635, partial [Lentisphaeria bacterium]|nr:hypothetical protein [Lentisphaeria bacterium]
MRRAAAAAADASGAWNTSCTASALCWPEFAEVAGPAEGFFRLARQRGRWWLITPRGRGYLAVGFNHAGPRYLQSPGNRDHWAQLLARPGALQAKVLEDARHWNLTCVGYGEVRPAGMFPWFQTVMAPCASCWMPDPSFPDVFHADFERDSLRAARQACAPWREDPALIGYLLNDVPEWPRPGHCSKRRTRDWIGVLKGGGRESPGKRRFVELLRDRHGGQIDSVNRIYGTRFHDLEQILDDVHLADRTAADPVRVGEDDAAFAALLVERWMEVVCGAVRQADGNHLLFGPRLDGNRGLPGAFLALASRHLDALAVQYYGVFRDQAAELARWHVTSGLPILLADSCFAVRTEALPQPCGVVVGSQEERAEAFERYAREALAQPWVIGWLWCGYVDGSVELEPRRQHMGLLDAWGQPYRPLVERMRRTYGELYVLARGGRDDARPPVLAEPPGSPPGTPAWPLPTAPFQRRLHPMARILKDAIQEDLEQMLEEGHPREA